MILEKLFTTQAANDTTRANVITATGRELSVQAFGTWGGATLSVYLSVDGTNGVLLDELTFTEDGWQNICIPAGNKIWAELSGVGTTSIGCWINGQGND